MMYMVIVNKKYMVQVEANSNAAAEHRILELGEGNMIESALSFNPAEDCSYFAHYFATCKMYNFADFKSYVDSCLKSRYDALAKAMRNIEEQKNLVDLLKIQLEDAMSSLAEMEAEYNEYSHKWGI